jgi:hypothetical protein
MALLDILKQAGGGQGLAQLAEQLGMDEGKVSDLAKILAPTIGSAAKKKVQSGGLEAMLGRLMGENQGSLFDDATQAASSLGQAQGMGFLKELLGGQKQTEAVAQEVAKQSGFDISDIMKLLPSLAAMAQGGLQKQMPDSTIQGLLRSAIPQAPSGAGGGVGGLIGGLLGGGKQETTGDGLDMSSLFNMLDANNDGSPLDDILGKLMK